MKTDTLTQKYFFKLSTNFVTLLSNIIIQFLVPRALGPHNYGIYHYLFSFFQQTTSFAELGTTQAYLTKLSKRQEDKGLISFYFLFIIVISAIIILLILLFQLTDLYSIVWPGQKLNFIYLAAFISLSFWYSNLLLNTSDALGFTIKTEKVRIQQKIFALIILVSLFFFDELNLFNFFLFNIFTLCMLVFHLFYSIFINEENSYKLYLIKPNFKKYIEEFHGFSKPLFLLGLIGTFIILFDRWLLQIYYGNEEQGFFGLAFQLSYVCLLFSTAMMPLITREFSVVFAQNNIGELSSLFRKYIPTIYSFVCFIACFIAVNSTNIVVTLAGKSFYSASIAVSIMSFYPIHQVYGQLGGSVFMASEKTVIYSKIGIFTLLPGLPLTYFLIGPVEMNCLNLGAMGLAIKMVIIQIISVNVQLFYISKYLNLNFIKYFSHQFIVIGFFLFTAFITNMTINYYFQDTKIIYILFLNLFIYSILIILIALLKPKLFGLDKNMIHTYIKKKYSNDNR